MRRRRIAIVISLVGMLLLEAWMALGQALRSAPPAGDYPCLTSRMTFSSVQGPAGPLMIIAYDPSALGTLHLDGKGAYRTSRSRGGRYAFNRSTGVFTFVSGPLKGWPAAYQVSGGVPTVRLAGNKKNAVGPSARVGEHTCRRRGGGKFTDTAAPGTRRGGTGGAASRPNGAFRGTLTFRESWGSNAIVDVEMATGKVVSRFEGTDPHRSPRGETVFVNKHGALVIAGRNGVTAATISTAERDERPDQPVLSPDGGKVAYHVAPVYYDSRVIVVTRDGKRLAEFKGVTDPDWTPDGRLVVANTLGTVGAKPGIFLSDAGLNTLKRIDPNLDDARMPRVSPDGKRIAFVYHGHLWVIGLDGSGLKQATSSSGGEERPAWSPDGRSLAAATREYGVVVLVSLANGKITEMKNRNDRTMQSSGRITWR